jgi:hypothetical protein
MTKTRIELTNRVGSKLMVKAAGQSLTAEDLDVIDEIVDPVLADLSARGIVSVQDVDAIELDVFEWIAEIIADFCATDFGQERNPQKVEYCEDKLHAIAMAAPTYEELRPDYF